MRFLPSLATGYFV